MLIIPAGNMQPFCFPYHLKFNNGAVFMGLQAAKQSKIVFHP